MLSAPTFAPLSAGTLAACAAIAAATPDPWSRDALCRAMADAHRRCFVALRGGVPLGFACFLAAVDTADLEQLAVAPAHRRTGVARALLLHSLETLRRGGTLRCLLEARASNAPALALYQSLGFKPLARRPGMYGHPPEDGLLMAIALEPPSVPSPAGGGPLAKPPPRRGPVS